MKILLTWLDKWYLWRRRKQLDAWREIVSVFSIVFIFWGVYRLFLLPFPLYVEEVFLKGLVFGVPVYAMKVKNKWHWRDLGFTSERLFESVYVGLGLGMVMGVMGQLGNIIRYSGMWTDNTNLSAGLLSEFVSLALATAFWEQLLFSGYIVKRASLVVSNEWRVMAMTASLFTLLYFPNMVFIRHLPLLDVLLSTLLLFTFQFAAGVMRLRFNNLAAPVLAQTFWGITIFLFG